MYNKCKMCWWREGGRCYNEKIATIKKTELGRLGELTETARIKCVGKKTHEMREKKLKRILENE